LLIKAREAMLQAVQTFNNPKSYFRSELFVVSAIIAWTYLFHAYYKREGVDYRYYSETDGKKVSIKTKHGAEKYWELSECLKAEKCPLDDASRSNLKFLIMIRDEVEHRMTTRIDDQISAKLQACCLNFNNYIKELFGNQLGLDGELSFALQFAGITVEQQKKMASLPDMRDHIALAQADFERQMDDDAYNDDRYAIRFHLVQKTSNRKSKSDAVLNLVPSDTDEAQAANRILLKEQEKNKWKPKQIVDKMVAGGYIKFSLHYHTLLWKERQARDPKSYLV
jgi:hypothetical protein